MLQTRTTRAPLSQQRPIPHTLDPKVTSVRDKRTEKLIHIDLSDHDSHLGTNTYQRCDDPNALHRIVQAANDHLAHSSAQVQRFADDHVGPAILFLTDEHVSPEFAKERAKNFLTPSPVENLTTKANQDIESESVLAEVLEECRELFTDEGYALLLSATAVLFAATYATTDPIALTAIGLSSEKIAFFYRGFKKALEEGDSPFHLDDLPYLKKFLEFAKTQSPAFGKCLTVTLNQFTKSPLNKKLIKGSEYTAHKLHGDVYHDVGYTPLYPALLMLCPIPGMESILNIAAFTFAVPFAVVARRLMHHQLGIRTL